MIPPHGLALDVTYTDAMSARDVLSGCFQTASSVGLDLNRVRVYGEPFDPHVDAIRLVATGASNGEWRAQDDEQFVLLHWMSFGWRGRIRVLPAQ